MMPTRAVFLGEGEKEGKKCFPIFLLVQHKYEHWKGDVAKQVVEHLQPTNRGINIQQGETWEHTGRQTGCTHAKCGQHMGARDRTARG